jgi:hypothetical protein
VSPRHSREFLLDSGAVTQLANDTKLLDAYLDFLRTDYIGSLRIPRIVRSEIHTGRQRHDALVELFINRLTRTADPYIDLTPELIDRAGVLRYDALKASPKHTGADITGIDALVVAIAEALSHSSAVTIVTTDRKDIEALITATGRTNIAVDNLS